jgi:CRP/FNR family transcriptional regulator
MAVIRSLEEQAPALRDEWMRRWQIALSETEDWASFLTHGTPSIRMARLLLKLAKPDLNDIVTLPNRTDIGIMLSIAMETASRIIAKFQRSGMLRRIGPRQYQIKRSALAILCSSHITAQPQRIQRNQHDRPDPNFRQPTLAA